MRFGCDFESLGVVWEGLYLEDWTFGCFWKAEVESNGAYDFGKAKDFWLRMEVYLK